MLMWGKYKVKKNISHSLSHSHFNHSPLFIIIIYHVLCTCHSSHVLRFLSFCFFSNFFKFSEIDNLKTEKATSEITVFSKLNLRCFFEFLLFFIFSIYFNVSDLIIIFNTIYLRCFLLFVNRL